MSYKFDHEWAHERERLSKLERGMDPGTIAMLARAEIQPDWRCLEIGAGGGSIAAWLAAQVGPTGHVTATDLQTSFVEALAVPNLEVRQHDIVTDDIPAAHYDLIHSRAVLEHVPARAAVLTKLVKSLKAGGCLVLECHDFCTLQHVEGGDPVKFAQIIAAMLQLLGQSGFDPDYGRHMGAQLRAAGLKDVYCEGRSYELGGDRDLTSVLSLVLKRLEPAMVNAGLAQSKDVAAIADGLEHGEIIAQSPMVVAAIGWKT